MISLVVATTSTTIIVINNLLSLIKCETLMQNDVNSSLVKEIIDEDISRSLVTNATTIIVR